MKRGIEACFIQAPLGIFHFDKDGIITDCNDEFATIIGVDRDMLVGFNMPLSLKDENLKKRYSRVLD